MIHIFFYVLPNDIFKDKESLYIYSYQLVNAKICKHLNIITIIYVYLLFII